jgi:cytochrome c5
MKFRILILLAVTIVVYSCATKITTPAKAAIPEVVSAADLATGKTLLESKCIQCHQIYPSNAFDKKEWKHITHSMQKKAQLNDVEINQVYNYIVSSL